MSTKRAAKRKADHISVGDEDSPNIKPKKQKLNPTTEEVPENAKMKENIPDGNSDHSSPSDQVELPPEILVSIFSQLSNQDLSRASCVCQHWWLCSKDETLAWVSLLPLDLWEFSDKEKGWMGNDPLLKTINEASCTGKAEDLHRIVVLGTLQRYSQDYYIGKVSFSSDAIS